MAERVLGHIMLAKGPRPRPQGRLRCHIRENSRTESETLQGWKKCEE